VSTAEVTSVDLPRTFTLLHGEGIFDRAGVRQPGKRALDIAASALLVVLLVPVLVVVAAAVWMGDRGPVLYRQRRVGMGGRPFDILKFRSMHVGADRLVSDLTGHNVTDGLLFKVRNDPRVTPVGRVIRRWSLDELPQLWNVLRGDMSLVGPRPLAAEPDAFGHLDHLRHRVPPGITGFWQVAGGNELSYRDMIELDLDYIDRWSLGLDLRVLLATIPVLLDRRRPC
jgi:lipopolysaccharide/colanic/teichoic acid biosynthesis glycosyltransferase